MSLFFFFSSRRRHTRSLRDWSSDVCSSDLIWPTLRAGAIYEHTYLLGTSMARPVIAKRQAEIALKLSADGLAHGCTGKGNDQVRFELAYKAIAPHVEIIAPWREWDIQSMALYAN